MIREYQSSDFEALQAMLDAEDIPREEQMHDSLESYVLDEGVAS